MLRYAPRFHKKNMLKKSGKKISPKKFHGKKIQKKISKKFHEFFFSTFFLAIGVPQSAANLGYACKKIWGSRPAGIGGDRDCTNST
jgi:hypothetical protein